MQKIIIFDSPDGTGKTNIAKGLSQKLSIPYFKYPAEHKFWKEDLFATALEFDQKFMASYLSQTGASLIWDRAYPAEWVYSQVYHRNTNMDTLRNLDHLYATMNAWIIVPLRADYSGNIKDDLVKNEELNSLHVLYNDFCDAWTRCNTIRIYVDTFDNNLHDELDALVDHITWRPDDLQLQKHIILRGRT